MFPFFILLFLLLLIITLSSLTTIPFSIPALVVIAVLFKKPWVFFAAFLLGLFLDLFLLRPLGYTSLILDVFVLALFLYERKFETQTLTFVFVTTLLGSFVYLKIFDSSYLLFQACISALFAALVFRLIQNSKIKTQKHSPD